MNKSENSEYSDIINNLRPVSLKHPRMPIGDRAAQFSPFAALTGYDDAIVETGRVTDKKHELSEEAKTMLDEKLRLIMSLSEEPPALEITYFVADGKKSGGSYVTFIGRIKRIDVYSHNVIMEDKTQIPIDDIFEIDGAVFNRFYKGDL